MLSLLLIAILSAWLAMTVVNQFRLARLGWSARVLNTFDRFDPFFLIPDYTFFAPLPLTFDLEVLYRDKLADASLTPWRAIPFWSTSPWRPLWNPSKRRYEIVQDLCLKLVRETRWQLLGCRQPHELYLSGPYTGLAHYVAAAPHSVAGRETQFLIAISPGYERRKQAAIAFVSPFYEL